MLPSSFIGEYEWRKADSGAFLDLERIELRADGTYVARVEATLVNPAVRSFGSRCMLEESGTWSAYAVRGKTKMRLRPCTNKARVYAVAIANGKLSLARLGVATVLFPEAALSNAQCA